MNFHIYNIYDVALCKNWPSYYTATRNQDSDDGKYIWAVGQHNITPVESFKTSAEMYAYCYANGWTKPKEV